jgi:glycosyltransferase involved in cell wall biosynthesis
MRIDMFVYNRCTTDARVLKEAKTLADVGHQVRILAVLDRTTTPRESLDGFEIRRIDRNPVHYRLLRGIRRLSWLARRGVAVTAARTEPPPQRPLGISLLLAPLLPLRKLAGLLWRHSSNVLHNGEAAVRRVLLLPHKPLMFVDYYRRAYRLVRAEPPQALHAHDLNTLPVAAALAWRLRLPLVYDAHELYPEISTLSRREAGVWSLVERCLARRATSIVTVCESIAIEIESRNGVPRPLVVLNCPDAPPPAPAAASLLRDRCGLPDDERVVLYQGGFAPNRGLETIIEAARLLEQGTIVLMGWGQIEEELRHQIHREGLGERVLITAPVPREEVVAYAVGADIGLIPYEPVGLNNTFTTPNKLFDYMAAGLPVVASRLPELVRFVEGEELGVTFAPGDPEELAAAIDQLLIDPARLGRMRERARDAGRRHTWARESQKLVGLYGDRPAIR